jgi:hypothetical protein
MNDLSWAHDKHIFYAIQNNVEDVKDELKAYNQLGF